MRVLSSLTLVLLCACGGTGPPPAPTPAPGPPETAPATAPVPAGPPRTIAPGLQPLIPLIQTGRFDQALAEIQRYRAGNPDDADGALLEGLLYHEHTRYAEAVPLFEEALALDPDYDLVQHFLGWARFHLGDMKGAREAFLVHAASDPAESDSVFGVGLTYLEEGDLDAAETRFRQAIDIIASLAETDPARYERRKRDLGKCYGRLGDVAFARGDYADAKTRLERALAEDPNQYTAVFVLSQVERRLGNDARADELEALHAQMIEARQRRPGAGRP